MPAHSPRAISLYTGAGGLDYGFEAAGFRSAVAVENDPAACRALGRNRPEWKLIGRDVHTVPSAAILHAAGLRPGEADTLIAGPPCQPFSKSGYWVRADSRRLDDPRADTLTAWLRVLRDTRPRTFLLENVDGLLYRGKDQGLRRLLEGIARVNDQTGTTYKTNWKVVNAAAHGVPQLRERVFLIGSRDGRQFEFPPETHGPAEEAGRHGREPYLTAWDALARLPQAPDDPALRAGGKWAALLPSIPEGGNYLWHTGRGGGLRLFGWRTRYWSFLLKLAKDQPAWTIQARPGPAAGPFHWRNRKLSVDEICRLQTFPEDVRFECNRTHAQRLLGNAVPSLLAEMLARRMRTQLLGAGSRHERPKLSVTPRGPAPAAEPVAPAPRRYLKLVGEHADHAGEGRGPAGRSRENSP